jgi:hypothetical protein
LRFCIANYNFGKAYELPQIDVSFRIGIYCFGKGYRASADECLASACCCKVFPLINAKFPY